MKVSVRTGVVIDVPGGRRLASLLLMYLKGKVVTEGEKQKTGRKKTK